MGYIKNADLTREDVLRLVNQLGYKDVTDSINARVREHYVLCAECEDGEVQGWHSLSVARRSLQYDIEYYRDLKKMEKPGSPLREQRAALD